MSNENHSIRKEEISNPNLNLKKLEKEEQIKPKANERKEINIRAETNETERRKTIEKINKTKSCFFEIINKVINLYRGQWERERPQVTNRSIRRTSLLILHTLIIMKYYKLYTYKFDNSDEMKQFPKRQKLSKFTQEDKYILKSSLCNK